ncbi:MAG: LPXTG-motif cell wall anchor protein, partial [Candidatus Levybacteria bacterium]|nr:LPXTG-motif cell wall anchor protein [Candidatus Levybacteria bacterium]
MQRIWILAFSFLIFLSSFSISFAKSDLAAAQTATPSSNQEVNYELPYPGLLPDSPLYFLRVTRDKLVSFLISDPLKKAEFDLLQADKRLNAGIYLLNSA